MRSAGAADQGSDLLLDASASQIEWAIYGFDPGCDTPKDLFAELATPEGNPAWLAVADYASGRWNILGSFSDSAAATLDKASCLSPEGRVYCALIAAAGQQFSVVQVGLNTETYDNLPIALDSVGGYGAWSSLLEVQGKPAIVYWDPDLDNLCFVSAQNECGSAWNTPVTVDFQGQTGHYPSAAIVDGNPAISYFDQTHFVLRYARADDPAGTSWSGGITLTVSGGGEFSSLSVVNGRPAISYWDLVNHRLRYLRANDPQGKTWPLPVVAVEIQQLNTETRLAIVDGNPAIAFSASTPAGVYFVRATDIDGASWGLPATLSSSGGEDVFGLDYFAGQPTVFWTQGNPSKAYFSAALDAGGTSWAAPAEVAGVAEPYWICLGKAAGIPCLAYSINGGGLYLINAASADGSSWLAPVLLDTPGVLGTAVSLREINGVTMLSYFSETLDSLCFFRHP